MGDFDITSLAQLKESAIKVYWSNWEDFVIAFDIEFSQKRGKFRGEKETIYGTIDTYFEVNTIFEVYRIGLESPDLFTQVKYDGKDGKLIFAQKTHIGWKEIEIRENEFDLNKKIHVRVTS